jgi:hypothetical protein
MLISSLSHPETPPWNPKTKRRTSTEDPIYTLRIVFSPSLLPVVKESRPRTSHRPCPIILSTSRAQIFLPTLMRGNIRRIPRKRHSPRLPFHQEDAYPSPLSELESRALMPKESSTRLRGKSQPLHRARCPQTQQDEDAVQLVCYHLISRARLTLKTMEALRSKNFLQ